MVLRVALFGCLLGACGGREPARVLLPVVVDGSGVVPVTNNLGWVVTTTQFRIATRNLQFTIQGEMHTGMATRVRRLFLNDAYAHPGHFAGGEVTGELPGDLILDFLQPDAASLGTATLLEGQYEGLNLELRRDLALDGHTVDLQGTATRGAEAITWTALVDVDEGTRMIGAPFELFVAKTTTATIHVQAQTKDPFESDTLYDDLDFGAYDTDVDGQVDIRPGTPEHNILRREVQVHDQYFAIGKN